MIKPSKQTSPFRLRAAGAVNAGAGLRRVAALGAAALGAAVFGAGCSDDPRVPSGQRFSERVIGQPGVVLIDDMEDGTQYIITDDGLQGLWYTYNDESPGASQEPAVGFPMYRTRRPDGEADPASQVLARECGDPGGAPFFATEENCTFVARTWGTGQMGWGAGMGLDLNGEAGQKNPFDASEYGGIGFFIIGSVRNDSLRVNVQDVRTTPESASAADRRGIPRCESFYEDSNGNPVQAGACNDHYGAEVSLSPNVWRWVEIPFACMQPGSWGFNGAPPAGFFAEGIVGIQFQVEGADPAGTGATGAAVPFDFAVDNLSFLEMARVDPTNCSPSF